MTKAKKTEILDIEKYSKLLADNGLPANTPKELVIDLLESLKDQGISRDDENAVESALGQSALWTWVQGEQISLNEELPVEDYARRIASLFGI